MLSGVAAALFLMTVASGVEGPEGERGRELRLAREPRLALITGLKCSACHINRTGGGGRNAFGSTYLQTQLPIKNEGFPFINRALNDWISFGSDVRFVGMAAVTDATPQTAVELSRANLYVEARLIRQVLSVYIDEIVGPNRATARELFGLVEGLPGNGYVKFGKFTLPYGVKLVDDDEFVRNVTGFNFNTPDQGVELGFEPGPLSFSVAVTNGSQGATEGDDDKQILGTAAYINRRFRFGASASHNAGSVATEDVIGGFAGFNVGPLTVIGEVDHVSGVGPTGEERDQIVAFGEGNLLLYRGVNAKFTYGYHDRSTDVDEDQRIRARFGLEVFPIPFLQASGYYVVLDDIPQAPNQQDRLILELHFFF